MVIKRFLLILFFNISFFIPGFSVPTRLNPVLLPWSIIAKNSSLDSLKANVMNANPSEIIASFKKVENTLKLHEQLKASNNPPLIFPVSAGVYSGSLRSDSLSAFDQLIFLYRNLCDRRAEAGAIHSYAIHNALNGDMDKALLMFNEALAINIALKNNGGMIKNYQNLAHIHAFMGNYFNAVKLSNTLVDISLKSQNNVSLAETYLSLSELLTSQNNFRDAENMVLKKALPLFYYKLNNKLGVIKCYDQLAFIYQSQKRFSEAKWFFIQSNILARKIDHPASIVNSLINLAHVKMAIGDWQLALDDIKEAEQLAVKNQYQFQLIEIKKDLSELYSKMGDLNSANLALSHFSDLKQKFLIPIN